MIEVEGVKKEIGIVEIAREFEIPIEIGDSRGSKRDRCPFCDSSSAFKTIDNKYYKCFRCGEKGDIIGLLSNYKKIEREEASKMIRKLHTVPLIITRKNRSLYDAFQIYVDNAYLNRDIIINFLNSRGISELILNKYEIGLSTNINTLQEKGWLKEDIKKVGLLSKNNKELFYNHVIFPFYSCNSHNITHIQGRNLDSGSDFRWISSINEFISIDNKLFNIDKLNKGWGEPEVFITEGLTDTYSLLSVGIDALGITGVNVKIYKFAEYFKNRDIVIILDNDKYNSSHKLSGMYKSWTNIVENLVQLQTFIKGNVYGVLLPEDINCKDINEYMNYINWDKNKFLEYVEDNKQTLTELITYLFKDSIYHIEHLVKAVAARPSEFNKCLLKSVIKRHYNDPIEYLINYFD